MSLAQLQSAKVELIKVEFEVPKERLMLPSPDILNNYEHGKFVLSNLAAKRAKQLREGAPQLVQCDSTHPLTIALAEIAAGKIKPIMPSLSEVSVPLDDLPMLIDEHVPAELGMLLPALDETEAALVVAVGEEDSDMEMEGDEVMSLSDLVEDDDDDVAPIASEDDTLSLSDIAEQETAEDDESDEG